MLGMLNRGPTTEDFLQDATTTKGSSNWKSFASRWKYKDVCKLLTKHRTQLDQILSNYLSVEKQSLAWSYVLGFKANEPMNEAQQMRLFLHQVESIMKKGRREHICLNPRPFTDAFRKAVEIWRVNAGMSDSKLILKCKTAITLLQGGNTHVLTYAHSELMACCVHSYFYHLAFPEISQELVEVQSGNAVKAIDNLNYHYYSGLVYIGIKNYNKALEAFTFALTAPAECVSVIQIECYKKYILLSLIVKQKLMQLPRYTPNNLKRYYKKFCNEYIDLADAFQRHSTEGVAKIVQKNNEVYTKDYNFGLVKQVMDTIKKNAIIKLTSVYTRLSIEKIAELCHFKTPNEAKSVLITMIRNNQLYATFDSNGVVTFSQNTSESDAKMLEKIHDRMTSVLKLWKILDESQLEQKKSNSYIKKQLGLGGGGGMGGEESNIMSMLGGGFRG